MNPLPKSTSFHLTFRISAFLKPAKRPSPTMGQILVYVTDSISFAASSYVKNAWCDASQSVGTPKSNREGHLPLTNNVWAMLSRHRQAAGFVLLNEHGRRFQITWFNRELRKACQRAGIRRITCHTLRHTFASHLAMAGAPLKAIQELLGHTSIDVTMRYAHLSSSTFKRNCQSFRQA
jgi:integrase